VRNRPNVTHCSTTLVDPDCNINPTLLSQTATLRQLVWVVVLLSGGNATLLVCACSAVKTNHWWFLSGQTQECDRAASGHHLLHYVQYHETRAMTHTSSRWNLESQDWPITLSLYLSPWHYLGFHAFNTTPHRSGTRSTYIHIYTFFRDRSSFPRRLVQILRAYSCRHCLSKLAYTRSRTGQRKQHINWSFGEHCVIKHIKASSTDYRQHYRLISFKLWSFKILTLLQPQFTLTEPRNMTLGCQSKC